jgi:hypothetical protein
VLAFVLPKRSTFICEANQGTIKPGAIQVLAFVLPKRSTFICEANAISPTQAATSKPFPSSRQATAVLSS